MRYAADISMLSSVMLKKSKKISVGHSRISEVLIKTSDAYSMRKGIVKNPSVNVMYPTIGFFRK